MHLNFALESRTFQLDKNDSLLIITQVAILINNVNKNIVPYLKQQICNHSNDIHKLIDLERHDC